MFYISGMKNIVVSRKDYKGTARLFLEFAYDKELISLTKTIPGATWSSTN